MLCLSRFSNPVDVVEYSTLAFMYLKVHLLDSYSSSIADDIYDYFKP